MVHAARSMIGDVEWGQRPAELGSDVVMHCPQSPFAAMVRAGILTQAQARYLIAADEDGVDVGARILSAIDFIPHPIAGPERRYPTARPRPGDIAVFSEPGVTSLTLSHVAICTGQGWGLVSVQANQAEPDSESNPTVETSVPALLKSDFPGAVVVICPFPF